MRCPSSVVGGVLAALVVVVVSACGGSSTTSPAASGSAASSSSAAATSAGGGGSWCQQAAAFIAQERSLATQVYSNSPGATPNVVAFQQIIASATQSIDSLDASVPAEIATQFHQIRAEYDRVNPQVQSATSFQQMTQLIGSLGDASLKASNTAVQDYFTHTCGLNAGESPAPS